MTTFLRLFILADIAYMAFMLSRPAAARRREKARQIAERQAKAEAAARAKAERDAQRAAAKAAREAKAVAQPKRKRGRPRKEPAPEPVQTEPIRPATVSAVPMPFRGNNAFAHEIVAFTGAIDGMTRAEAIKAVEANGGRAFDTMPAGTTILVVGDKPGMNKLDKADRWIGQVRKITQAQFKAKLSLPLTLSPDEFAACFAPTEQ